MKKIELIIDLGKDDPDQIIQAVEDLLVDLKKMKEENEQALKEVPFCIVENMDGSRDLCIYYDGMVLGYDEDIGGPDYVCWHPEGPKLTRNVPVDVVKTDLENIHPGDWFTCSSKARSVTQYYLCLNGGRAVRICTEPTENTIRLNLPFTPLQNVSMASFESKTLYKVL